MIGLGAKVKSIKSLISASHTLVLTAVGVSRIGTPEAISAALGVYTGSSEVWLLKVPVPEVLQV